MATGVVKWFNKVKGYGFIIPDKDPGPLDVFVHKSALDAALLGDLKEGQRVRYDLERRFNRSMAVNICVLDSFLMSERRTGTR